MPVLDVDIYCNLLYCLSFLFLLMFDNVYINICIFKNIFLMAILDLLSFVAFALTPCFLFANLGICHFSSHDPWSFYLMYMVFWFGLVWFWLCFVFWHMPDCHKFSSILLAWNVFILPSLLKYNSRWRVIFFSSTFLLATIVIETPVICLNIFPL